ncbi:uncharacterized protein HGUI_03189 [Hanseniaspora guilliermondii]|uniref:Elongator complex protein 4 n=1 Tax=Hanseniaspora guilliermondii TaxID=56406 RepID=A0A1L0CPT0_9ASCO|nr:uncharacterized protein HGUI_03189 [Hanseniaspora guilliermondii]
MSFQRRNQAIGSRSDTDSMRNISSRVGGMSLRDHQSPSIGRQVPLVRKTPEIKTQQVNILGVKPSVSKSSGIQVTSIGSATVDNLVFKQHGGIPVGTTTLIKDISRKDVKDDENLKYLSSLSFQNTIGLQFIATGLYQQRRSLKKDITDDNSEKIGHLGIVVGEWIDLHEIPGVYISKNKKHSSSNNKDENESIVSKLSEVEQKRKDLKIAWRYGMKNNDSKDGKNGELEIKEDPNFVPRLDIQGHVFPAATREEVLQININGNTLENIFMAIQQAITKNPKKLIRLYLPNFLNPKYYPKSYFQHHNIMKFLNGLKTLQSMNDSRFVTLITTTTDFSIPLLETFSHTIVELKPFDQQTIDYLTKNYKSQGLPNKVQQGMLNVTKMAKVSEFGHMAVRMNEIVYHVSKNGFVVELWSIPVDAGDDENKDNKKQDIDNKKASKSIEPHGHDHSNHSHISKDLEY